MASAQEVRIPDDHKVVLTEMMKEKLAKPKPEDDMAVIPKMTKAPNNTAQAFEVYTNVGMMNRTPGKLTYDNYCDFSGSLIVSCPYVIERNHAAGFLHEGVKSTSPKGSKGAVVYWAYNHDGPGRVVCGWLLAWHTPIGGDGCKTYVECGPITNYTPNKLNWGAIEQKLDRSSTNSSYKDYNTGAEASAAIEFAGDRDTAQLVAFFNVSN